MPVFKCEVENGANKPAVHIPASLRKQPLDRHSRRRFMTYMCCWLSHDTGTTQDPTTSNASRCVVESGTAFTRSSL